MVDPRNEKWRATGAGVGPVAIGGEYVATERATAERLLHFLADRRVLFAPFEIEDPNHCVQSVLEIRKFLTELLMDWPQDTALRQHVMSVRAACREFIDSVSGSSTEAPRSLWRPSHSHVPFDPGSPGVWLDALGRFRTHVGYHVAAVMQAYDLMVEDQLGVILPPAPDDGDGDIEWDADRTEIGPFFGRFWDR